MPLVLNYTYNVVQNMTDTELKDWKGFEGIVATFIDKYTSDISSAREVLDEVGRIFVVDRQAVMVVSWRGRAVLDLVGSRPGLFQFGFCDSPWGGSAWPPPMRASGRRGAQFQKVRLYYKLTGIDYKKADRGFDDAKMKKVQDYWKGLGVKDLQVERYPKSSKWPQRDGGCIGYHASARAKKWFEEKLVEIRSSNK